MSTCTVPVVNYCDGTRFSARFSQMADIVSTIFATIFGRPLQVTVRPMLRDRCPVCPVCPSITLVYYIQTYIKNLYTVFK